MPGRLIALVSARARLAEPEAGYGFSGGGLCHERNTAAADFLRPPPNWSVQSRAAPPAQQRGWRGPRAQRCATRGALGRDPPFRAQDLQRQPLRCPGICCDAQLDAQDRLQRAPPVRDRRNRLPGPRSVPRASAWHEQRRRRQSGHPPAGRHLGRLGEIVSIPPAAAGAGMPSRWRSISPEPTATVARHSSQAGARRQPRRLSLTRPPRSPTRRQRP